MGRSSQPFEGLKGIISRKVGRGALIMGLNVHQFRSYVLRPSLERLNLWSQEAEMLLLGTALTESGDMHYLHQLGEGPAKGIYQMEPRTHEDIYNNYLEYRKPLRREVLAFIAPVPEPIEQLMTNLAYATVMCRIHYLRIKAAIPGANDLRGLAEYWKEHYNTGLGAGQPNTFVRHLREAI